MTAQSPLEMSHSSASRVLGRRMDSIPFSRYQVLIIFILALVGFIEGYDLFMTGSLLVLAKAPVASDRHRHPVAAPRDLGRLHPRACSRRTCRSLADRDIVMALVFHHH